MDHPETEEAFEGVEVAVAVEKLMVFHEATCRAGETVGPGGTWVGVG